MLRVFSKSNDLSCNDYIKNIKGKTILSNLKTNYSNSRTIKTNSNKIVSYLSYNDFLTITQTFYKFSNLKKNYKPPQKIIDLKTSFIFYNKILNHIQSCNFCKTNSIETFFENCKEIKNILYPYGEYFTYEIYSNLASVDLDYWCKKECIHNIYCDNKFNGNSDPNNNESNSSDVTSEVSYKVPVNQESLNIFSCNSSNDSSYYSSSDSSSESCCDSSSISSNGLSNIHAVPTNSPANGPTNGPKLMQSNTPANGNTNGPKLMQSNTPANGLTNSPTNERTNAVHYINSPTNGHTVKASINYANSHMNNSVVKISSESKPNISKIQENNTDNFVFINSSSDTNSRIEFITNSLTIHKNTFNIFIAELSNSKEYVFDDKTSNDFETEYKYYNVYNFIPIYINFDEFKKVFYNSVTKYFNISDIISEKIKLSSQYFESINNKVEPFLITTAIKKIYIEKNNYNEMDANTLIEIEKETNNYFSLYDFNYIKNSLNLDEFIHIINKNNIEIGSEIKVRIKVYYKSQKTSLPCIMYFNYILQNIN